MEQSPQPPDAGDLARSFLVHAAAVFIAMNLSYALLDGVLGPIGAAAILTLYVLGRSFRKKRQRSSRPKVGGARGWLAALLCHASGFMTITGATAAVIVGWLSVTYEPFDIGGMRISPQDDIAGGLPHALILLAGGLVSMALSVLLLNWGQGGLGRLSDRLRRHGPGLVLAPWLTETALLLLLSGGVGLFVASVPIGLLVDAMSLGRADGLFEIVERFPFVALGLAALAVLATASVHLLTDFALFEDMAGTLQAAEDTPRRRDARLPVLATFTLAGSAGIVGSMVWGLHVAFLAAGASVPALLAAQSTADVLDERAFELQASGHGAAEFIAAVNENGSWLAESPQGGLVALLPALAEPLAETGLPPGCRIAVAAAAATAEDAARPVPDLPDPRPATPGAAAGADTDYEVTSREPRRAPPLRYCVKVTCPVPVTWDAPAALALYSSHPSGRPDWLLNAFFDMFAEGRAAAPGGYCTVNGQLAPSYQG